MRKEAVKFKWVHKTKWKTLKHLSNSFTDMDEAIRFIRHNKTECGLQLKQQTNCGELQWDNL